VAAAAAVSAFGAMATYAYFSADGTGSGRASIGGGSDLVVAGSAGGVLYPGSTVPVSLTTTNPSVAEQRVGTVYLAAVRACTGTGSSWDPSLGECSDGGTEQTGCESVDTGDEADAGAGDFYMADVTENQTVAGSSTGVALANAGVLTMNNLSTTQDSCQNATVYLQLRTK
jgi:hypothetical protein